MRLYSQYEISSIKLILASQVRIISQYKNLYLKNFSNP
jgi:hypothetical protein